MRCGICKKNVDPDDEPDDIYYPLRCYGCGKYVCNACRVFTAELCIKCDEEEQEEQVRHFETGKP
jgi:hypothetical protein